MKREPGVVYEALLFLLAKRWRPKDACGLILEPVATTSDDKGTLQVGLSYSLRVGRPPWITGS